MSRRPRNGKAGTTRSFRTPSGRGSPSGQRDKATAKLPAGRRPGSTARLQAPGDLGSGRGGKRAGERKDATKLELVAARQSHTWEGPPKVGLVQPRPLGVAAVTFKKSFPSLPHLTHAATPLTQKFDRPRYTPRGPHWPVLFRPPLKSTGRAEFNHLTCLQCPPQSKLPSSLTKITHGHSLLRSNNLELGFIPELVPSLNWSPCSYAHPCLYLVYAQLSESLRCVPALTGSKSKVLMACGTCFNWSPVVEGPPGHTEKHSGPRLGVRNESQWNDPHLRRCLWSRQLQGQRRMFPPITRDTLTPVSNFSPGLIN